jgi:chromosome segregation ATPase
MKSKRIDAALRTIQLNYEETKPLSEYETQIIERYIEIHGIHADYERAIHHNEENIQKLVEMTGVTRTSLKHVKKRLHDLLAAAGELNSGKNPVGSYAMLKLQSETEDYNLSVKAFHGRLCEANLCARDICEEFSRLYMSWDNRFEEQLEEFNAFVDELYEHYENYQLDISRFYDDHDEFTACLAHTDKKINVLSKKLNIAIENWESLANEATLFYDFVKNQDRFRGFYSVEMQN